MAVIQRAFVVVLGLAGLLFASDAAAQAPRNIPHEGYGLHDEREIGPFTVQRWVSSTSPEVSPSGMCECITLVYAGSRLLLTFGMPGEISAATVSERSGADFNGDGFADVILTMWSGGAHCCYATTMYSIGSQVKRVLALETGNCGPGEFEDLDGDGIYEFTTCDDTFAYAYCSFADSPLPRVVYAYDAARGEYVPATPRFASRYRDQLARDLDAAQTWLRKSGDDAGTGLVKCRLLQPALGLMYLGRLEDGLVLIRVFYRGPDREQFEREILERVRQSPHWVPS